MTGISVIVPCHDLGRTVVECIESATAQTWPAAELVLVDDGSKDSHTLQVLAVLEARGVCVVHTPNRGVAAARNLGVAMTSAPYIVLLDADDVLEPTYLEKLGDKLDRNPQLHFVTCGVRAFGEASYVWTPPAPTWVQTLVRGGPHISTMFRRSMWNIVGGFDDELPGYEDTEFWLSALEKGCLGDVIDEPLLRYRVRKGSRYHRAIGRKPFVDGMQQIYAKHAVSLQQHLDDVLEVKRSFCVEQQAHRYALQNQATSLEREVGDLRARIRVTVEELESQGQQALDWGDLRHRLSEINGSVASSEKSLHSYYVGKFLELHGADIVGHVARTQGSTDVGPFHDPRVRHGNVVEIEAGSTKPVVTRSSDGHPVREGTVDCLVMAQTLQDAHDVEAALQAAYEVLVPGGVLLCTVPCAGRLSTDSSLAHRDHWRLTPAAVRGLFAKVFPLNSFEVTSYGNVMAVSAALLGLSHEDVPEVTLNIDDPSFPLICCVRAGKPKADSSQHRRFGASSVTELTAAIGVVLMYHRVAEHSPDPHGLCVTPDNFRAQMNHLREACHPISLEELVQRVTEGRAAGSVAVTFDDGYLDSLTMASPILQEFGIPATFFVNTAALNERHEFWWDLLARIFLSPSPLPDVLDLYGDGRWSKMTRTETERTAAHQSLVELLYAMPAAERNTTLTRLSEWSALDLRPRDTHRPMMPEEVCELARCAGHTIGAHTVHHLSLPGHPPDVQRKEIVESKQRLEALLGQNVTCLSYPYGECSGETVEAARYAGFRIAVTVEQRAVRPGAERLLVPRVEVKNCDAPTFGRQLQQLFI